ncbi:hypothetical protein ACRRTK_020904 [Alexandromys fortis]
MGNGSLGKVTREDLPSSHSQPLSSDLSVSTPSFRRHLVLAERDSLSHIFGRLHPSWEALVTQLNSRFKSAAGVSTRPVHRSRVYGQTPAGRVCRGVARRADAGLRTVRASPVRGLQAPPPPSRRRAGQTAAAMFVARSIAADHKDLIHDVSFDFHGRRMATCSSDQSVKVWDKSESGDWHCTASWKTHSGSVWRVTWAHPEFGQVLASCSFDRTAAVWEEIVGESNDKLRGQSHWVKRTTLVDSRTSVTDVKFAPKHMGLMLATCSADGIVRIYEAPDVMNLSQWSLQHEISCKLSCSCISWNPSSSRAHSPMIAVGSDDSSPNAMAKVQIFEYNENTRKYAKAETLMTVTDPVHDIAFAPNLGRSFHILAIATKDVRIFTLKPVRKELTSSGGPTKFEIHIVAQFDNHNSQVWRVSWNITGTVLASSGDDGCVRLWKANYMDNWKCTGILKEHSCDADTANLQYPHPRRGLCVVKHEVPLDTIVWRTAVYMTILPFAVTILRSCFWYFHYPRTNLSSRLQICGQSSREMEDFQGIAEEAFPSFLTNSLLGNSEVLENVTLSSNFGLPIAVSTLARNRSSTDNRKKSCIENPHLSLALMKPGTEEKQANTTTSVQCQRLLDEVSPLEQTVMPDAGKHLEDKAPNSDFSHISLLENEKLLTLTNLEDTSDDDINDEEFYDDHLEAYFEQLAVPGMLYEAGGQESPENVFKLPAHGNNILNCEFQLENNSSLVSHGAYTSGSSGTTHRESEEGRGCLLGTSGYAGIVDNIKQVDNVLPFYSYTWRTEKEGAPNLMDVVPDQSREYAGEAVLGKELRSVDETPSPRAGEAVLGEKPCTVDETPSPRAGEAALGEKPCTVDETLSSPYSHSKDDVKGGFDLADSRKWDSESPHQNKHLASDLETVLNVDRCLNTETPSVFIQKGGSVSSLKTNGDGGINSPDTLWSPTCERRACEFYESVTKPNDQADLSQNIVYQNEDGKWVTDLAYYTSFTDQQDLQMSPNNETNEDFRSGRNLNEQSQAQLSKGSITLQAEELQSTSQGDENDVTLTANESRTEDIFCSNNKLEEHKSILSGSGDSVLRISTIASAIADVSVSTDPAQLVAMMKALKNKRRDKTFQDDDTQEDCSTSHFLINDVEKSNRFNAFDMEKYLTKTEVSSCEGTWEPFSRAGTSDIWDLCLLKQQTVQDISMANVCAANVRQPKADSAAVFYGENTESETQESLRTLASPDSGLSNMSENRSTVIGTKACSIDELPDVQTVEKAASVSIPTSSMRNPRVPSLRLLEKHEEIQDSREHRRKKECVSETSCSDKHVTFEEDRVVLPKSVDLTISSPESGGSGFEDQGRFRLSTSPLSHSSPSEISGNLSGYALESLNLAPHQKPHSECELSELACSRADMSRLTYVSEQENTYPITAGAESLEDHKSDLTSELSTTIVRASPTPSEEETTKKLRDEVLSQTTEKVSLPSIIQVEPAVGKVAETPSLSSGFEDGEPNFTSSQDISSRSGEHLEASGVDSTSGPSEQNLFGQAFLNKPGLGHLSGPAIPSLLVLNQKTVDQSQRITSTGVLTASSDSSSQIPNLCTSVNHPSLAPHISVHTSAAKVQNQPPLCPALWTGHSLYTAPVAPQYLGPVPSSGNAALPQCHAGVQVCGISGCSPCPLVAPEHVASGMCLGPNLASGVMGPSSLYNLCSTAVHQNLLSTAKPFPVQPVAANCETKPWDLGMMSGFGNARVPEELRFPHACCVGIASQTLLSVLNPTDRWLQVSIRVLSICVNGEKVDLSTQTCLVFKNKVVIRPHATEEIKILFIPTNSGIFRCTFSVASWPFSADADTVVQAEALGSRVTLTAVAETPVIEVETEKKGVLDFGDLTYEGWKALPLKLINRTHATVPIRLIINANALAWRCFTFSKEPIHASLKATPYSDGIAQLVAPSVVSHVMPASYDGQVAEQGSQFSVDPESLFLKPGEEHEVVVSFTPKDPKAYEERLQKLALRNSSTTTAQNLRLLIKGQDQDCFQEYDLYELGQDSLSDVGVSICGATYLVPWSTELFEYIPLSGYGGTSNLILEDVKKLSDSYLVTVNDLIPGKESKVVFSIRNTGSRAAFVKAVCFKDSQRKVLLDPKVMRIFPDKFVLKERTQEDITLIYSPSHRKNDSKPATELLTVYFFGGDEISRQLYRRALLHKPGAIKQILPEHSVLQNIDFAEAFQDELLTDEAFDLPQRPNDIQLFYGSMRKITLSVIGEFRDSVSSREFLQPSSSAMLESKSESGTSGKQSGNVSLDVLPVKGPQGPPFPSHIAHPAQDTPVSEESWAIHPEHLILVAPSSCDYLGDMAKTGRFQIINNSVSVLKFELYWPAHCLTVTPQHGFITPQSKIQILVSPNSSLSTKQSMFPWTGLIYIHCDNGQKKMVKVQIREDLTQEPLPHLASSTFGILVPGPEPSISHLTKPVTKLPSTKVAIRSKTVIFPPTEPGQASENYLELENCGPTDVKWHLSSFAPPYVKGVDETGDVFRATYTAFRCSPISGTLEGHGIQKVSIMFLPRDGGDYAQFWDVECHPANEPHMKHTLRFQLSGQSIRAENDPEGSCSSRDTLIKVDAAVLSRRRAVSETSTHVPGRQLDLSHRGVYAPKDVYMFLPTKLGESRTLKVNLRNNSFFAHALKFLSPRAPFYIKHSKYSLRARHYIHIPVHFRPESVGRFEALLVIQTDEGKSIAVRLIGEALGKS